MARRVAQSLMAPGNVKARGQRMFLRRREKADHWTADALGPRPPPGLRRAAAARAAAAVAAEQSESDAELPYYNPAPWSSAAAAAAGRSPWSQAGAGAPSWTPKPGAADTSPTPGGRWLPVRHVEPARPMPPPHSGNVAPQVAFGLAKELTRMHDKGGRMFAKRWARAAVEESDHTATTDAVRGDVMRRIADSYVPPARHDLVDSAADQSAPSATRLIEMIEKSRATSGGPGAAHPASG